MEMQESDQQCLQDAVLQLLCVHLGLGEEEEDQEINAVRSFRDFYRFSWTRTLLQKRFLLQCAVETHCSSVLIDVLLFLSQTLTPQLLQQEIAQSKYKKTLQTHWKQVQMEPQNHEIDSLYACFPANRTDQAPETSMQRTVSFLDTSARDLPAWTSEFLREYVEFTSSQVEIEARDVAFAPNPQCLSGIFDKRSRGKSNFVQVNWRKRFFQVTANDITYWTIDHMNHKHVQQGRLVLTKATTVESLDYVGKVSKRPFCIVIQEPNGKQDALIIDVQTRTMQVQWLDAIHKNLRRLQLDPKWTRVPRVNVTTLCSITQLYQYMVQYHDLPKGEPSASNVARRFQVHPTRCLYLQCIVYLTNGNYEALNVVLKQWSGSSMSSMSMSTQKTTLRTKSSKSTAWILDRLLVMTSDTQAPLSLVATLEALLHQISR